MKHFLLIQFKLIHLICYDFYNSQIIIELLSLCIITL